MRNKMSLTIAFEFLILAVSATAAESSLTAENGQQLRRMQTTFDYTAITKGYADFMIEQGRDRYGAALRRART